MCHAGGEDGKKEGGAVFGGFIGLGVLGRGGVTCPCSLSGTMTMSRPYLSFAWGCGARPMVREQDSRMFCKIFGV